MARKIFLCTTTNGSLRLSWPVGLVTEGTHLRHRREKLVAVAVARSQLLFNLTDTQYLKVPIINNSKHPLPEYQTSGAAAFDVCANIDEPIKLGPLERYAVPTGLHMAVPAGYEAQVRPRSGLSAKFGISVLNTPGTIDSDYRGELKVILVNLSNDAYTINDGDRIAQVVVAPVEQVEWDLVDAHDETTRGAGGFGHTGR